MAVRGIGRLRAGGGGSTFTPASINFTSGLWLDPSDISTGFQDSAGTTPQTAAGQPTGRRNDKSGRGNNVLQATAAARPTYDVISGISSDYFDGLDDILATGAFSAGTLTANMDCFIAVQRSGNALAMFDTVGARYLGATAGGGAVKCDFGSGSAHTYHVDGVAVAGGTSTTEAQLTAALTTGVWHVLEIQGVNLSAWLSVKFGYYSAGAPTNNDYGGVVICPAQSADNRTNIRRWLGAKVGLSL